MNKVWTIIKREYLIRVTNKAFILATILTPLSIALLIGVSVLINTNTLKKYNILLSDPNQLSAGLVKSDDAFTFTYHEQSSEAAKDVYEKEPYDILVLLEDINSQNQNLFNASYVSKEKIGLKAIESIEKRLKKAFKEMRIQASQVPDSILSSFEVSVNLNYEAEEDDKDAAQKSKISTIIGTALGGLMGFMMYLIIFIYGGMVMKSVMEEKINRIVEVIISSVKPFQLLLGKITGVGLVGLTQLLFWLILIPIIIFVASLLLGSQPANIDPSLMEAMPKEQFEPIVIIQHIMGLNWYLIIPVFVLFFLGGYFMYSSMYAAIGSVIGDDMGESQSLMLPIMVPVILAFMMLMPVLEDPHGNLAVFGSLFPLFSPVLMPARLAFDPPLWQIILSVLLLLLTSLGSVWVTARIYRVGILMYGKKFTFKEIGKLIFSKF